ncbi:MAG: hypothetical protein GX173_06135 [Ruminococcaceae bacterium]|jgi:hypothetical protein|nr:hypothetical protein [Oscillospiraceae bacterium]
MFGYVRPLKSELLVREFARYRSVYCGLCHQIRQDYGQLPRLAVSYDLTLLALLLLSLADEQPPDQSGVCLLNPFVRRPIAGRGTVLQHCAALSVLLAWYKAEDERLDGHSVKGYLARMVFARAKKRAQKKYPVYAAIIGQHMAEQREAEKMPPDPDAAAIFGRMLHKLVYEAAAGIMPDEPVRQALGLIGDDLGRWIYLMDAIDDWQDDCNNNNWNPYGQFDCLSAAKEQSAVHLAELETALDRTAALLPYVRDSGLMANVFTQGLPFVREQVFAGVQPGKL